VAYEKGETYKVTYNNDNINYSIRFLYLYLLTQQQEIPLVERFLGLPVLNSAGGMTVSCGRC
jgi:hypothetical protein